MDVAVVPSWHAQLYTQVHDAAVRTVAAGGFRLVFVHYPIPHEPFIYDRRSRRVGFSDSSSYLDNVALADRALAELLDAVDRSGRSAQTAVIVTADHGLRRPGWRQRGEFLPTIGDPLQRAPLIVRLPGQRQADVRHETVRTVRTHDAAVAILKGVATRPDEVAAILAAGD